jgi:hypothetical protein
MAYIVNKTDGSVLATVADGSINTTSTNLSLIGKNYAGYGEAVNENFVRLLENFAANSAPSAPLTGQLWWDNQAALLKVYDGGWKRTGGATSSASEPLGSRVAGDFWFDTVNNQLKIYTGTEFLLVGPQGGGTSGDSGSLVESILDNAVPQLEHMVIRIVLDNTTVAYYSKDAEFVPAIAIPGFITIRPGLNLSTAITNNRFTGNLAGTVTNTGINSFGTVIVTSGTESENISTGALRVTGGVGISGRLNLGGDLAVVSGTASGSTTTGALTVTGGVGISGRLNLGGDLAVVSGTASGSTTTGALTVTGGVGVSGRISTTDLTVTNTINGGITGNAGTVTNGVYTVGDQTIAGTKTFSSVISGGITGNAGTVTNGVYTVGNQSISGIKSFTDNTASSSISTGTIVVTGGVGISGAIFAGGDVTAFATSDSRLKTNIQNITMALDKVSRLNGVEFYWNDRARELYPERTEKDVGVIAQEVQEVLPEIVTERDNGYLAVRYEKIVPLLIEAIKELRAELDELKSKSL